MEEKKHKSKECEYLKNPGTLFIPVGFFLGLGIGFWAVNIPAGIFIGLGLGLLAFVISLFVMKKKF